MNEVKLFEHPMFGTLRFIEDENGKLLFCGKDVATALGYAKPQNAIQSHCRGALKRGIPTISGVQEMLFIPEGDVYRLTAHSRLPEAVKFESWVFEEIVPSVVKTGSYSIQTKPDSYMIEDKIERAKRWIEEQREYQEKQRQLEADKRILESRVEAAQPAIEFTMQVSASTTDCLIRDLAKLLNQNGVNIGEKRLFEWMRNNGYLIKDGRSKNTPTQYAMDRGLFRLKLTPVTLSDGRTITNPTPLVTAKGVQYFLRLFCSKQSGLNLFSPMFPM